jgi:hypothetical protein
MKKVFVFLPAIAIAVMFNACSKTGNTGPQGTQGPAGPSYTGTITGHIDLYDQYGGQILNSKTARAILYNSSNVVIDSMNADSTGRYTFANISTGFYTLAYRDSAYGEQLHQDFQFLGGGTLNVDGKISQIANFNITSITVDSINHATGNVVLSCAINTDTKARTLLVFASGNATVSNSPAYYLTYMSAAVKANATTVVINFPLSNLYDAGLVSGQTAYFGIYGAASNYGSSSSYEDLNTGRTVITCTSTAEFTPPPTAILP